LASAGASGKFCERKRFASTVKKQKQIEVSIMQSKEVNFKGNGRGENHGSAAKNNSVFSSKWTHLPIGVPYWNGGWTGGQPELSKPAEKTPFFRVKETPPDLARKKDKGNYEPSPDRVMY
jgi:hypothetical protein